MSWNPARHSPLERPLVLALLALSIALAGCIDGAGGESVDSAATEQSPHSESMPVEHPVSVDLVIPFYVYYSVVASDHCDSEIVRLDGPIIDVDVTATWDVVAPETLDLRVYPGTKGKEVVTGHEEEDGRPLVAEEGPSPLRVHTDVEDSDAVRLRVCQRDNLVVAQAFHVHLQGSIQYLAPVPETR